MNKAQYLRARAFMDRDRIPRYIASKMPKRIMYWVTMFVIRDATTGVWSHTEVPALTAMDAVDRFSRKHGIQFK